MAPLVMPSCPSRRRFGDPLAERKTRGAGAPLFFKPDPGCARAVRQRDYWISFQLPFWICTMTRARWS